MENRKTNYVIPHTHWDREWRYPIWKNRMLLIEFMDELLRILDTDPAYKGADSGRLLDHVMELIWQKGYVVGNVDVTIICQRPKLKDYIETMRENVAAHLKVDLDCVNVKATTTEKLGFEGEGLGISTHAVACIYKK